MLLITTTFYVAKFFISGKSALKSVTVYTRDTADVISSLKSPSPNNDSPWHCLIPPPVLFIFSGRCYWLRIILYKLGLFCGCCVLSSLWVFFLLVVTDLKPYISGLVKVCIHKFNIYQDTICNLASAGAII